MMPVIRIGSAAIPTASLALILALWVGASIGDREARQRNLRGDDVWTVLTLFVFVTVILGRLSFVAQNLDAYATDWTELFSLSANTLVIEYGVLCGLVAVAIYIWWKRISLARFADALAIGLFVALIIVVIGQFFSGDAYGTTTDVPWAIESIGSMRHPVQIYELSLLIVGLIVIKRILKPDVRDGIVTLFAIVWYSGVRLVVDAFHADVAVLPNGYRISQVVALIMLLVALWGIMRVTTKDKRRMTEDG